MGAAQDVRGRIRDFVISRRERVSPGDVGIHEGGGTRRVKGLRREEVAMLAGVSVEYYVRFERGDAAGASDSVIDAIARVLRLSDVEREYLRRLCAARTAGHRNPPVRAVTGIRPSARRLLESMETVPAFAVNRIGDIVAANILGRAFYVQMYDDGRDPVNHTWFQFLRQEQSRRFWVDWDVIADNGVQILRAEIGAAPLDPAPLDRGRRDLLDELLTVPEFRSRWNSQNVRRHTSGTKRVNHPIVGRMDLAYENLHLDADPDLAILTFSPEPGTPSADAMQLLNHWARDGANASRVGRG
ncbi:helix-turn-helix domain-containing protein [Millisia brevis]|uniref:helix-turn-helix domain-containing protein n=1 Tax=Millisia brevis TaxID=264148 RepID=UPI000830AE89|nr:helix-turn-helix transcriptional regulator [Millisia brevis]